MRLLCFLLASWVLPAVAHAQDAEALFESLAALASVTQDDDSESDGICGTDLFSATDDEGNPQEGFTATEWLCIAGTATRWP